MVSSDGDRRARAQSVGIDADTALALTTGVTGLTEPPGCRAAALAESAGPACSAVAGTGEERER